MEPDTSRNGPSADATGEGATGESGTTTSIPADDLYRALAGAPRRRLLGALLEESPRSVDELADRLAAWRAEADGRPVGSTERRRVSTSLCHVHLPLLQDVGLVTRDDDGERVRLASVGGRVREVVQVAVEYERHEAPELPA